MRRVTLATLCLVAIAAPALAPAAAAAEPARARTDVRADRRATAESIAAQYAAEQFRAARIGDETTRKLLDENDAQRRRIAAVLRDARATAAQRDEARAQLKQLDTQLNEVNARLLASEQTGDELRAQLREYQRQITDAVDAASPEVAAAYELYAQGDRDTAYEVIDRLSQVEAAAAKRAGEIRAGALMRRPAVLAFDRRDRGEMTLAQVIAAWERAQEADPAYHKGWIDLTVLYIEAGRLPDARKAAEKALAASDNDTQRGRSNGMLGEVLLSMGDSRAAEAAWDQGLKQLREAYAATPDDDDAARGVIALLDRVGDLRMQELSYRAAARIYAEELDICRRRAAARPDHLRTQRDLMVCLSKIGDANLQARNHDEAKAAFEEVLAISRRALAAEPENRTYQREAVLASLKMGEFHTETLRSDLARPYLDEALTRARQLAAADPTNALARRDLWVTLEYRSRVVPTGSPAGLREYRKLMDESLQLRRDLIAADPTNVQAQRDLGLGLGAYALVHIDRDDLVTARRMLEDQLAVYRKIAASPTANGHDHRRVGVVMLELARVLQRVDTGAAAPVWVELADLQRKLAAANPQSAMAQHDLGLGLYRYAEARNQAGDKAGALMLYRESVDALKKAVALDESDLQTRRVLGIALKSYADTAYELEQVDVITPAYQEAADVFYQLRELRPTDAQAHQDFYLTLAGWASMVTDPEAWANVVKAMEAAEARGLLDADGRKTLARARELHREAAARRAAATTAQPSGAPQ